MHTNFRSNISSFFYRAVLLYDFSSLVEIKLQLGLLYTLKLTFSIVFLRRARNEGTHYAVKYTCILVLCKWYSVFYETLYAHSYSINTKFKLVYNTHASFVIKHTCKYK